MKTIKIDRHTVELTQPNKLLFANPDITKSDLINYYIRIAPTMLPLIKKRPITMQRFVHGANAEGFFHKDAPDYFPHWIERANIKKQEGETVHYVVCNNTATLVYLANQLCITPHIWLSTTDNLKYHDRMIFDIDPSKKNSFTDVKKIARFLKQKLEALNLATFVMTTGSRGVHVVVPLKPVHTFDAVRAFAHTIATECAAQHPTLCTIEVRKAKRGNRIFIDTLRNAWGQTAVAPYAVRALPGAPVATPVTWDELFKKIRNAQQYTIKNIFKRLSKKGDVWKGVKRSASKLPTL